MPKVVIRQAIKKTLAKVQYLFEISKCAINTTMPIVEGKR
ncbi:hypothetical protein HMPREF9072_00168 [Capnocytophaga sp. oral taxon 324 str. F0483]|nr:hypothetical protein HMPREF9072_00168 [Capnocytophaga sp. oral taxon 324 str. F0483]